MAAFFQRSNRFAQYARSLARPLLGALLLLQALAPALSAAAPTGEVKPRSQNTVIDLAAPGLSLRDLSDQQLTDRAADWERLDPADRAALLAETRARMLNRARRPVASRETGARQTLAGQRTSGQSGPLRIERRYGRVVRQADGSVVRIETQVVRIRRSDPKRAFGVGFENRRSQDDRNQNNEGRGQATMPAFADPAP